MVPYGFQVDESKCTGCGLCGQVCGTGILYVGEDKKCHMTDISGMGEGWGVCFHCQHCLAVCPQGAISIFGKKPEDSLLPSQAANAEQLDALIANRRSCRMFRDEPVSREMIDGMLKVLENAPTGSGSRHLEYTVLDDMEKVRRFEQLAHDEMMKLADQGRYPTGWKAEEFAKLVEWEPSRDGDLLFCRAPYLFIAHAPTNKGSWKTDGIITSTYFELLCASRGLGCIFMGLPINVLGYLPEVRALLGIPEDHYYACIMGFGWPKIRYARGSQKDGEGKINRPVLDV